MWARYMFLISFGLVYHSVWLQDKAHSSKLFGCVLILIICHLLGQYRDLTLKMSGADKTHTETSKKYN